MYYIPGGQSTGSCTTALPGTYQWRACRQRRWSNHRHCHGGRYYQQGEPGGPARCRYYESRDYAVTEDTPINEIALLLTERKIKRVPVVSEGKLAGIVSRADIVHAVAEGHLILRSW